MQNLNLTKTQPAKSLPTLQELAQNLRSDYYYFACSCSAGDTYRLCLMKPALAQKYKDKIIFIIKPSHEAVCEMFEGLEYVLCESQSLDICGNRQCLELDNIVSVPALGKIYSHFINYGLGLDICASNQFKFDRLRLMLSSNAQRVLPTNLPKIDKNLQVRLDKIAPLDKIVLLCPEANSFPNLPFVIFKKECERLRKQGYSVIVNALKHRQEWAKFFTNGVYDLDLSLKDAIALGIVCAGVISVRAGFCDIVQPFCKHLKIYYTEFGIYILWDNQLWHTPFEQVYIYDEPVYKAFLQMRNNLFDKFLPLKLYQRYIAKGFLRRVRTPFTAYFKIYKNHKKQDLNESNLRNLENFSGENSQNLAQNSQQNDPCKEFLNDLAQTYEFQIGLLLEKACKGFWRGGFLAFPFAYFKLRKRKKTLTRLNEILG